MKAFREALAATTKGWLTDKEGNALYQRAKAQPGPYLEVGSYRGKSAIYLGSAAQKNKTVLFTVDHHRGSPEMAESEDCYDPDILDEQGRHDTLPHLRKTLELAGLEANVVPVVASTQMLAPWIPEDLRFGFVFIDGAHDPFGVRRDYGTWAPHADVMAFHDREVPGIAKVIEQATKDGWETLDIVDDLHILQA